MDWPLEVVVLPVSDSYRSVAFYRDQVGFELDHDTTNEHMHVVQLTPRGSGCSIVFGDLPSQREMEPGSMRGLQLCVADAEAARAELVSRGVDASELMSFGGQDGSTFFGFADPDGNTWAVQELNGRSEAPLIPIEGAGAVRAKSPACTPATGHGPTSPLLLASGPATLTSPGGRTARLPVGRPASCVRFSARGR